MAKEKAKEKEKKTKDPGIASGTMVLCDDGEERPTITREEAIEQGLKRYFTGLECKNGHIAERKVKGYVCVVCARLRAKARHKKRLAEDPEYKEKFAAKRRARHKDRYQNDPDYRAKVLERAKKRRARTSAGKTKSKAEAEIAA